MLKPVNRIIFVIPEKSPEKTESGIFLPEPDITKIQTRGVVHSSNSPLCNKGDKVVFTRASPVGIPTSPIVGSDSLMIIYERDLAGVDNGNDEPFPIPADK